MAVAGDECRFDWENTENEDYLLAQYLQDEEWCASSKKDDICERDLAFALQLQQYLNESNETRSVKNDIFTVNGKKYTSLVDANLETADPTPDVWHLFRDFDQHFFNSVLVRNGVLLEWSKKMTSCAGVCQWSGGQCSIRLSFPLLTLRKRSDLIETLLHEMIHAYLFVTRTRDDGEHGRKFHEQMFRINKEAKTNISVYHSFHNEVRHYQQHIWRCDGPCRTRGPYFGYVRRAVNRAPGPSDTWWNSHQSSCTGKFSKMSEPNVTNNHQKSKPSKRSEKVPSTQKTIEAYLNKEHGNSLTANTVNTLKDASNTSVKSVFVPFSGRGHTLTDKIKPNMSVKEKLFTPFSGKGFSLGTPTNNNQVQRITAAKSIECKLVTTEDEDDVLITSFYENKEDDEFIRNIDFELITSTSLKENGSRKHVPTAKEEFEIIEID